MEDSRNSKRDMMKNYKVMKMSSVIQSVICWDIIGWICFNYIFLYFILKLDNVLVHPLTLCIQISTFIQQF